MTRRRGFTLIEVSLAILLVALMMTFAYQIVHQAVMAKDVLREGLEGPKVETAILDQLIADLRFVYYRPGQFPGDRGFWGRTKTVNGVEGDRLDFLSCRRSRVARLEDSDRTPADAPIVEVGYACRGSERWQKTIELWRREDYFVDDDPVDGGRFHLVHDRIRRFDLQYYPPPEERSENERPLDEWNTSDRHRLPYAIVVHLQYDVRPWDRETPDAPQASVRRIILLTPARSLPPDAGMSAMDPGMTSMR